MQEVTLADGEAVRIGSLIQLTMVGAEEGKTTLAVDAPEGIEIAKDDLGSHHTVRPANKTASASSSDSQSAAAFADEAWKRAAAAGFGVAYASIMGTAPEDRTPTWSEFVGQQIASAVLGQ
jgi:sRNA-binding carbon storage regulator CsrA